jgi:CRP-like cAMP-binding protein
MVHERIDVAAVLQKTALFSSLTPAETHLLAARTSCKRFDTGELLFSEGEKCHGLHIIAHGRVRIFKTSLGGREQVLALNVSGECVAELPVFDGGAFPASAVAIENTEIAFISRPDFHAFFIEELSFTTVRQRLISALLRLAEAQGKQTEAGLEFQLPASHQELASQLGTVRELISRNLMRLQAEGLLDVSARQIVVKDMKGLRDLLGEA